MQLDKSGIRVSQYLTELPPRKLLEKKLHESIRLTRERLAQRQQDSAPATTLALPKPPGDQPKMTKPRGLKK